MVFAIIKSALKRKEKELNCAVSPYNDTWKRTVIKVLMTCSRHVDPRMFLDWLDVSEM